MGVFSALGYEYVCSGLYSGVIPASGRPNHLIPHTYVPGVCVMHENENTNSSASVVNLRAWWVYRDLVIDVNFVEACSHGSCAVDVRGGGVGVIVVELKTLPWPYTSDDRLHLHAGILLPRFLDQKD